MQALLLAGKRERDFEEFRLDHQIVELVLEDDGDLFRVLGAQKAGHAHQRRRGIEIDVEVMIAGKAVALEMGKRGSQYALQRVAHPAIVGECIFRHIISVLAVPSWSSLRLWPPTEPIGRNRFAGISGGLLLPGAPRTPW